MRPAPKLLLVALLLAAPATLRAQPIGSLNRAMFVSPGGDCTLDACNATNATRQLCRNSTAGSTVYACDSATGFFVPVGSTEPQSFAAGFRGPWDAVDVSTAAPGQPATLAWETTAPSIITPDYKSFTLTLAGALTAPTLAPTIVQANGTLPIDTYHVKLVWVGRYSSPTTANGMTAAALIGKAVTDYGPEVVNVVPDSTHDSMTVTLAEAYPDNAVGFDVYCNRDGDAIAEFRRCSGANRPTTSANVTSTISWSSGSDITANNTVDREMFGLTGNGWMLWDPHGAVGTHQAFAWRPFSTAVSGTTASKTYLFGPELAYSGDSGTTTTGFLRDPVYDLGACGNNQAVTLGTAISYLDGTNGPAPTAAATGRATIRLRGPCGSDSATWKSGLDLVGQGQLSPGSGQTLIISLTGVTDATFTDLSNVTFTGSGCNRIRIRNSQVDNITLTDCDDVILDGITLAKSNTTNVDSGGYIVVNGGTYTIENSDLTPAYDAADATTIGPAPVTIGTWAGAGTLTAQTRMVLRGNTMAWRESSKPGPAGFFRGFFDASSTSEVVLEGNTIVLDNSNTSGSCNDTAPSNGGLIAINSGEDSTAGRGRVNIRSVGNVYWTKSCEKGNVFRLADLDDDYSTFVSIGDDMRADTTATGSGGLDDDTHCVEWAIGAPGINVIQGGSCIVNNDATGFNRPFYVHSGCCASTENPQIYIRQEYIRASSTDSSVGAGNAMAIGNFGDTNSGADFWLDGVVMEQSAADSTYNDLYISEAAIGVGSTINVNDSSYAVDDYTDGDGAGIGGIRIIRSRFAQVTAPTLCTIGDSYTDTSGAVCACTATNTWTNMSGVGACT